MRKRFGMFTPAGDKLVYSMVATVKRMIKRGVSRDNVLVYLTERWLNIDKKYGEATDSEVRDTVMIELDGSFRRAYGKGRGLITNE